MRRSKSCVSSLERPRLSSSTPQATKSAALETESTAILEIATLRAEHEAATKVLADAQARIKQLEEQRDQWTPPDEHLAAGRGASEGPPAEEKCTTTSSTPGAASVPEAPGFSAPVTSTTSPTPGAASALEAPGLSPTPSRAELRSDSGPGPFSTVSGPEAIRRVRLKLQRPTRW